LFGYFVETTLNPFDFEFETKGFLQSLQTKRCTPIRLFAIANNMYTPNEGKLCPLQNAGLQLSNGRERAE